MKFAGIIFDFDGVLLESEHLGTIQLADYLTSLGHPTSPADSMANFMGLNGTQFIDAIERWIGESLPDDFAESRAADKQQAMAQGVDAVAGAVAFVRALPADLPRAIASSSSKQWIRAHLDHLGLRDSFEPMIFSGVEDVERGKPAPDVYCHAAAALGQDIGNMVILEDSPVGVKGAVASGAHVIGLCAGLHCAADHGDRLKALGVDAVASDFDEVRCLLDI
ncbi:HAD family phosphatase [Stakelama sp. CBK3Z-3]|uniref:HAD family phosphatase n=1 Tax=Stakelama flava TaxID=2860338 RepID=A0ABS6XMR9_9SPHN|nr:HAD family phosphatase [Stakelama flava]MBW4330706.1 HAD family phosphatase [Stakelama flava]